MKKEKRNIDPKALLVNTGQIDWLPANPRTWTQGDIDKTSRSIAQDPDFLEDRPILVVADDDMAQFVVFAGNLRTTAAQGLALKSVPVVVYYPETEEDREAVKRRTMKDNGSFGEWDNDALANEWDDLPLVEFGVPTWNAEEPADESLVDDLFEDSPEGTKEQPAAVLSVVIPMSLEDKVAHIREAIKVTLEEWPECKVN